MAIQLFIFSLFIFNSCQFYQVRQKKPIPDYHSMKISWNWMQDLRVHWAVYFTTVLCNGRWSKLTPAVVLDKQLFCTCVTEGEEGNVSRWTSIAQFCYYKTCQTHHNMLPNSIATTCLCLFDFRKDYAALHNMLCCLWVCKVSSLIKNYLIRTQSNKSQYKFNYKFILRCPHTPHTSFTRLTQNKRHKML